VFTREEAGLCRSPSAVPQVLIDVPLVHATFFEGRRALVAQPALVDLVNILHVVCAIFRKIEMSCTDRAGVSVGVCHEVGDSLLRSGGGSVGPSRGDHLLGLGREVKLHS